MTPRIYCPSLTRGNILLLVFVMIHLILIDGVNSRPPPREQDGQHSKKTFAHFEEQDESSENRRGTDEDILQEIMAELGKYKAREENIHREVASEVSSRRPLRSRTVQDEDESEMMGDMPAQDDDESEMMGDMPAQDEDESEMMGDMPAQDDDESEMMGDMPAQDDDESEMMGDMPAHDEDVSPRVIDPIESISRRMNFFPGANAGTEGMDSGGAIKQMILRAQPFRNHSNDRGSMFEELATLRGFNLSTGLQMGNASILTSLVGAAGTGISTGVGNGQPGAAASAGSEGSAGADAGLGVGLDNAWQKTARERHKELRLKSIKEQILTFFGMMPPAVDPAKPAEQMQIINEMVAQLKNQTVPRSDIYLEKVQSFYPTCDLPKNTDEDLWNDAHAMNLLFDLSTPAVSNGTTVNVIAAKLRLYKLSQKNSSVIPGAVCAPTLGAPEDPTGTTIPTIPTISEDDQKIRVSVYWYTRSLKKNKLKRKLLDSKMLSVHGDEWTEFNVKQAAIEWRSKLKPNRNFGLVVEVENEDNVILPAAQFLSAMNCSKEASTTRPIPGFLVDAARYYILGSSNRTNDTHPTRNASFDFNDSINYHSYLFPMIDLCTNEVPIHEAENAALYIHAQQLAQHSVDTEDHSIGSSTIHNASEAFQQYQRQVANEPLGEGEMNDEQSVGNQEQRDGRAMRHPRRPQENTAHRRRHHHGEAPIRRDLNQGEQAKWNDTNGFQLRKQIIQKVILTQQREAEEAVQSDDR